MVAHTLHRCLEDLGAGYIGVSVSWVDQRREMRAFRKDALFRHLSELLAVLLALSRLKYTHLIYRVGR